MDPAVSLITALIRSLALVAQNDWKDKEEYKLLRHLAHERISRELFWNIECLRRHLNSDSHSSYLDLIRTDSFDDLVEKEIPLDRLFEYAIKNDFREVEPYCQDKFRNNIQGIENISELIDRVYNRLWMLKHRKNNELPLGDVKYLLDLTIFTYVHTTLFRRNYHKDRQDPKGYIQTFSWLNKISLSSKN
ncbi:hypothetical protein [Synechococcus elongatus]|uniref:hypothetical protein n=1 Tax=Synechococcus elongatus TaxID=32046 RepID=UPI0030D0DE21